MLKNEPSKTALICAFSRAHHSRFTVNKIYDDYLAYRLLGENDYSRVKRQIIEIISKHNYQIPRLQTWNEFLDELISPIILSRIKFTESRFLEFAKKNKQEKVQYLICGAGLDSYSFRNKLDNVNIFEMDHPNTNKYKKTRIQELGWEYPKNTKFVAIDFERENLNEVLISNGFDTNAKTFVSILGVAYYLDLTTFSNTIENISQLINNEVTVVFDYPERSVKSSTRLKILAEIALELGEKMKGGMEFNDLEKILTKNDFVISEYETPDKIQRNYFRNIQSNIKAYDEVNFIMASKKI